MSDQITHPQPVPQDPRFHDLTDRSFGKWTVLAYVGKPSKWLCRCECGTERIVFGNNLVRGGSLSCSVTCLKGGLENRLLDGAVRAANGCWEWTRSTDGKNYGRIGVESGKAKQISRVSYELFCGPIPKGLFVLHRCDNPLCCNPTHLFLGTNYDNVQDMVRKGRSCKGRKMKPEHVRHGEDSPSHKLTEEDVKNIRRRAGAGEKQRALAAEYHVTPSVICVIVNRKSWTHVPE